MRCSCAPSLPLSLSPSPSSSRLPSSIPIAECSRIRQHACDIPVPVGICLVLLMPIRQLLWMNGAGAGYLAHDPLSCTRPAIRRIDGCEPMTFFFNAPARWNEPSSGEIDLGCLGTPSSPIGKGGKNRVTIVETFEYLAHAPSKQLLNISGTDNTSAEGKQRVVVFRRRNNPSQIKTRKQTRERDVERARVRKLAFTLPSRLPSLPSPLSPLALLIRRAIPRFQSSSVRKCRGGGG